MPASHVQSKSFIPAAGAATTVAVTFTNPVVAGNLIVGMVTSSSGATVSSVTDSLGNTYTILDAVVDTVNTQQATSFYAKNILGGADTVTATFSVSIDSRAIIVHEASGLDTTAPLDVKAAQLQATPGTATDALTSGAAITTAAGEYIFGSSMDTAASTANTIVAGTGYTAAETPPATSGVAFASEFQIQGAAGSIAATFTDATRGGIDRYITHLVTFKAAAGASFQKSLAGTLSFVGNLRKLTKKALGGGLSFAGAITKQLRRGLAGTLSFAGAIAKQIRRVLSGALSFVGTVVRQIGKGISGVLTTAGGLGKKIARGLAGILSFVGGLVGQFISGGGGQLFFQSLSGALSFSGSVSKRIGKSMKAALSAIGIPFIENR